VTQLAEFTLEATAFPLGRLFADRPDATLELDRVVPTADTVMPYFWVHDAGEEMEAVLATFEKLPELRSVTLIDDLEERALFRAEWEPAYMGIMAAVAEAGVAVVSASGSTEGWLFEIRAETADQLAAFQEYCRDHDIDVSLTRLRRLSDVTFEGADGLTPTQREALTLAYAEGYYAEPRETDLATLAEQLGISRQAFGARLRRGYRSLIESALVRDRETGE
jgi:predicted DNA binding protein